MNIIEKRFYLWGRVHALIDLSKAVEINIEHFQFLIDEIDAYWYESEERSAEDEIQLFLRKEWKKKGSLTPAIKNKEEEMHQEFIDLEEDYAESLEDDSDYDPYANYSDEDVFRDAFDGDIDAWNHWNQ